VNIYSEFAVKSICQTQLNTAEIMKWWNHFKMSPSNPLLL